MIDFKQLCIYCGQKKAAELDHIPPKCFFPSPRPNNLITVPSCKDCNRRYGKVDEQARNLITSLERTEVHNAIQSKLSIKRDRSYRRKQGKFNFYDILDSIVIADVVSSNGIYLGKAPAFNLDTPMMNLFIERMTRALLFYENSIGYVKCEVEWRMAPTKKDMEVMPSEIKQLLLSAKVREVGGGIFSYAGLFRSGNINSLWILSFYSGIEFMSIIRESH